MTEEARPPESSAEDAPIATPRSDLLTPPRSNRADEEVRDTQGPPPASAQPTPRWPRSSAISVPPLGARADVGFTPNVPLVPAASSEAATFVSAAFDALPEPTWVVSKQGALLGSNRAFASIADEPWLTRVTRTIGGAPDATFDEVCADGRVLRIERRALQLPTGQPGYWLRAIDVSDEVAARDRAMTQDRLAALGALTASIGHEIKNPLMYLLTNLEVAADGAERMRTRIPPLAAREELASALDDALEGARRVAQIVQDLRSFSHPGDEERRDVDLRRVVASALRLCNKELSRRALVKSKLEAVPLVSGSEPRLGQVVLNLLINAAQALPTDARELHEIRVATGTAHDGGAFFEVADSGPGIPPAVRARLFQPFVTTKPAGEGSGLGLSICQRIVSAHGGSIEVTSHAAEDGPGPTGTTFRVLLPATGSALVSSRPPSSVQALRVLIVDDDEATLELLHDLLGHHVLHAAQGADEAVELLRADARFDLLLVDERAHAPLVRALSERWPLLARRVVQMTRNVEPEAPEGSCLGKPIDADELALLLGGARARLRRGESPVSPR
jgi:signal transduction histidine kinase